MIFYLSSYKFGNHPKSLVNLFGINKKVALITNALDCYSDIQRRQIHETNQIESLKLLGLQAELLDLRVFFGKRKELEVVLNKYAGVWVNGGNTFVLRIAYKLSGFDEVIKSYNKDIRKKDFVYSGFSAGGCILQDNLKGVDLMDEPFRTRDTYDKDPIWEGLGILDFAFVPHFESDHPESLMANLSANYYKKNKIKYKTLKDGDVIIINN